MVLSSLDQCDASSPFDRQGSATSLDTLLKSSPAAVEERLQRMPSGWLQRQGAALVHACIDVGSDRAWNVLLAAIDTGVDVNVRDSALRTPLHRCVEDALPHLQRCKDLLQRGADTEARCNFRRTVLQSAVHCRASAAIVQLLIDSGAQARLVDRDGGLLHHLPSPEIIDLLLRAGCDLEARDSLGGTAVSAAASAYHARPDTLRALLARGAQLDVRDDDGFTPLHCAVMENQPCTDVFMALLEHGADLKARDNRGHTVRQLARSLAPRIADQLSAWSAVARAHRATNAPFDSAGLMPL